MSKRRVAVVAAAAFLAGCGGPPTPTLGPAPSGLPSPAPTLAAAAEPSLTSTASPEPSTIDERLAVWRSSGVDDYHWTIEVRCFCVPPPDLHVVVADGRAVQVTTSGGEVVGDHTYSNFTVDDVFELMARTQREGAVVTAEYGPFGEPTSVTIDAVHEDDDEFSIRTTGVTPDLLQPSNLPETPQPLTADEAWTGLFPGEPEAVSYKSLAAIKDAASAVVVGRIASVDPGPDFGDEYGNVTHTAIVMVDIEAVLDGVVNEAEPGKMKLRTVVGFGTRVRFSLGGADALDAGLPRERAILFVENVAARLGRMGISPDDPRADPEAYQIISGDGFLREVDGVAVPPAWVSKGWSKQFRGRPFDLVIEEISGA